MFNQKIINTGFKFQNSLDLGIRELLKEIPNLKNKIFQCINMNCRICNSTKLSLVFDLGLQPWGNNFLMKEQIGKEKFYPLELLFCKNVIFHN